MIGKYSVTHDNPNENMQKFLTFHQLTTINHQPKKSGCFGNETAAFF